MPPFSITQPHAESTRHIQTSGVCIHDRNTSPRQRGSLMPTVPALSSSPSPKKKKEHLILSHFHTSHSLSQCFERSFHQFHSGFLMFQLTKGDQGHPPNPRDQRPIARLSAWHLPWDFSNKSYLQREDQLTYPTWKGKFLENHIDFQRARKKRGDDMSSFPEVYSFFLGKMVQSD